MKTEDARALCLPARAKQLAENALTDLVSLLEQGKSEALTAYLATMARFHHYSWGNALLIHLQRPDATMMGKRSAHPHVAGFHTWRKLGRIVQRGEHGIVILAPMLFRRKPEEQTDEEAQPKALRGFRGVYVFDVTQTEGEPLPEFAAVQGDPSHCAAKLKALVAEKGIALTYTPHTGGAEGVSRGGSILLRPGLSPAEEFSVLVHEFAHELLHQKLSFAERSRRRLEIEAEAVAFVVCHAIGLDTNTANSDYLQLYGGNREALEASLESIQRAASTILTGLLQNGH